MSAPVLQRIEAPIDRLRRLRELKRRRDELVGAEKALWQKDGPGWVNHRLDEFLWSTQRDIMDSVRDHRFTAVKACHGPGKAAWPLGLQRGGWKRTRPGRPR